ncbi:MAG: pyruvate kinase [Candidatus Eremiobacterota bacterium]
MILRLSAPAFTLPQAASRREAVETADRVFRQPAPEGQAQTRVVATLGPASSSVETLSGMLQAGLDVARLNCSHVTDYAPAEAMLANLRTASDATGKPVSVLLDLRGSKVRIGELPGGKLTVRKGDPLVLGPGGITFEPEHLVQAMEPGRLILLKDGAVTLRVLERGPDGVECQVVAGGTLTDRCGVAIPGSSVRIPAFTDKDRRDLEWGLKQGVTMAAVSMVQCAEDLEEVRRFLDERGSSIPLVAKIEDVMALRNLDEIIQAADVIMVARGDMGVQIPRQFVPLIQKQIIARCRELGKPVIVATEMMESMIEKPRPERAEDSDVINAFIDGAHAVMASGETAVGKFPVDVVRFMDEDVRAAEEAAGMGALFTPERFSSAYWQRLIDRVQQAA